nr:DUF4123 domain-containing protein [Pseudomonas chlororaphis]
MTPQAWLAQQPLQADERLYLVISNASDANPLKDFYQTQGASGLTALWSGTPYADWQPVMPYLVELKPTSPFLDWIATTDADDWGWLAVSSCEPTVVFEHLRSLTQVKMPDGAEVFFRFWDGRHIYPILEGLGEDAPQVLPIFDRYLINGRTLDVSQGVVKPPKPFPWWDVPEALVKKLTEDDPSTVIDNMMQWLLEDHAELYFSFPESNLRQKVTRFVKRTPLTEENYTGLLKAHLENEVVA